MPLSKAKFYLILLMLKLMIALSWYHHVFIYLNNKHTQHMIWYDMIYIYIYIYIYIHIYIHLLWKTDIVSVIFISGPATSGRRHARAKKSCVSTFDSQSGVGFQPFYLLSLVFDLFCMHTRRIYNVSNLCTIGDFSFFELEFLSVFFTVYYYSVYYMRCISVFTV